MDFLDPNKKRKHRIRLFIGYGLLAIALSITTAILTYQAAGYDARPSTGVFQNGILFVDAHPEPAQIFINDAYKGTTDSRFILPEGTYRVVLQRDGYHNWTRTVNVRGGQVRRLVYPFMIPAQLEQNDEVLYGKDPALFTQSPDRRWLLAQSAEKTLAFQLFDLANDPVRPSTYELAPSLLTNSGPDYTIEAVEWSDDNRHLIVKNSYTDANDNAVAEFIRIDREDPKKSIRLDSVISTSISEVRLKNKQHDQFYVLSTNNQLLRVDKENALPVVIAENVIDFKSHSDKELLYVVPGKTAETVDVMTLNGDEILPFRSLPVSARGYVLDLARFENDWVVAVGSKSDAQTFVYVGDFFNQLKAEDAANKPMPASILRTDEGEATVSGQFSATVRFFAVQSGASFSVYDVEEDKKYDFDVDLSISANHKVTWMDGHRLTVVDDDSTLYMFDFDGLNQHNLADGLHNKQAYFDRDYDRFFSFGESIDIEGRMALRKTYLRAASDR